MTINKKVAQNTINFIGGNPKVAEFADDANLKRIDILKCIDTPQKGVQTCASIGLNCTDIGLTCNDKKIRVEIVGASDILIERFENIVASVAFEIMDAQRCFPGYIVKDVIEQYIPDCEMKHILLTDPFLWEGAKGIVAGDIMIEWLMLVPISEAEYGFACENGVDMLEEKFEESDIDVYNMYRKSVI